MNKKGFVLVKALTVVVLFSVVSVTPMMNKSKKSAVTTEGLGILNAAEVAYQAEGLKGSNAAYKSTSNVCFDLKYLCEKGFFDKGCGDDEYSGSVLAEYKDGEVNYTVWFSNGSYVANGLTEDNYSDTDNKKVLYSGKEASLDCGKTLTDGISDEAKKYSNSIISSLDGRTLVYCKENCE